MSGRQLSERSVMSTQPLGIGVIGAGHIISRHAPAYRAIPAQAKLVGVSDLDRGRADAAASKYGFPVAVTDYRKLLDRDDIQAVSICTPAATHTDIAVDALRAGKHVLIEKPLATTLADADRIIAAAEQHPRQTVACMFQLRLDPAYLRLKWIVANERVGRPLLGAARVRLRKHRSYFTATFGRGSLAADGGGVVINQAIHQIDALLWLLGEPVTVCATMATHVHPIDGEDALQGCVRFASGAMAAVDAATCAHRKEFALEIVCENAGLRLHGDPDAQAFDWAVDAAGSAVRDAIRAEALRAVPGVKREPKLVRSLRKLSRRWAPRMAARVEAAGHGRVITAFLDAAATGAPGPMPPREARRSLALVTALYESARRGTVVRAAEGREEVIESAETPRRQKAPTSEAAGMSAVTASG